MLKLKLELREGTKDAQIAREVIEKDCYRLKSWEPTTDPKVIIDVGCQIGCFSALACGLFPDCRVLSFEMVEENFLMAQNNLKDFKNNECINVAVGGKNPVVGSFYNHNNTGGHKAVFEGADSYIGERRVKESYELSNGDIKTTNFKQIFEDYNLEEIDFLKLDCEGSEHEILPHLFETGLINKVKNIALEMHGREEEESFYILSELEKIYKSVKRTGAHQHLVFCQGLKTGYKTFSEQTQNDFEFLTKKGLEPDHYFLDVGCGGGRIAYHAIQYLNKGRYFAFDKEDEMIDPFMEELQKHPNLLEKEPVVHLSDFNINFNKDIKFDFIYAHSVFTHVTPELITEFMINLKKHFSKSTKFFATFHLGSEGCDIGAKHGKRKNEFDGVWYTVEYLTDIMSGLGFRTEFVGTDTENWENFIFT